MANKNVRKLFTIFKSMKFGITLLILIMVLSIIGTIVPQGMDQHFYSHNYPPIITSILTSLGLDDVFNSIIFATLFISLTINLIMCSIFRLKVIFNKLKANSAIDSMELFSSVAIDPSHSVIVSADKIFRRHGFYRYSQDNNSKYIYNSVKKKAGYFGSWLLHLGIMIVIVYYAYGHITYFTESVYGIPGTVQEIKGTQYKIQIDDFKIEYNVDGNIQQYISNIQILDSTGNSLKSSKTALNEPLRFEGYSVYQTAYGWATKCDVSISENNVIQDVIYEKTSLNIPDENIAIYLNRFYPDFAANSKGFITLSDQLKKPVVLYSLFYMGEIVKMDIVPIGEVIKWNEYEFTFHSPERYTYLDVNRMKGQIGAAIGAVLITIGLILVFYYKPERMVINVEDGKLNVYRNMQSRKAKITYQKEKDSYVR